MARGQVLFKSDATHAISMIHSITRCPIKGEHTEVREVESTGRFIGAMHGVKRTEAGRESPTEVAILADGRKPARLNLKDETAEHGFLLGTHTAGGLNPGDTFVTLIEGLSGQLATAAARIGKERGFRVLRIPAYWLKQERDRLGAAEEDDPVTLARLAKDKPELFWPVTEMDQLMGELTAVVGQRKNTMSDRRSATLRVIARVRRERYRQLGMTSIGPIEEAIEQAKASSRTIQILAEEEAGVVRELEKLLKDLPHWAEIFEPVAGIGPVGAAEMMASIKDIRRFETASKLCAYFGVHLRVGVVRVGADGVRTVTVPGHPKFSSKMPREVELPDGVEYRFFPVRRRTGLPANWDEWLGKQALYKFASYHFKQWWMGQPPDPSKPKKDRARSWEEVREGWSSWTKKLDEMMTRRLNAEPWKSLIAQARDDKERRYFETRARKAVFWRFARSFTRYVFNRWWALERRLAEEAAAARV